MISITLPSIYPDAAARALCNIRDATRGAYQVILVSPFKCPAGLEQNVTWVHEKEAKGCAAAHARAVESAKGEYIVAFADDHQFVAGWDEIALSEQGDDPQLCLGLRDVDSGHVGTNFGIFYPYFPFTRTDFCREVGWIGADYRAGFGDSDLGMRVWSVGGRCEFSTAGLIRPTLSDKRKSGEDRPKPTYTSDDLKLFVSRWAPEYGYGWVTDRIEDFNVDLRPADNAVLCYGNTIYYNDPVFMTKIVRMV